jgi:hypothetical protein
MVGWAGGRGGGPDFFVYTGADPAVHWSHDHTVWGELDKASLELVQKILKHFEVDGSTGMSMLKHKISFTFSKENMQFNGGAVQKPTITKSKEKADLMGSRTQSKSNSAVSSRKNDFVLLGMLSMIVVMVVFDCVFRTPKKQQQFLV